MTDERGDDDRSGSVGEMARRVRAHDWSATALGPAHRWPPSLRAVVDLVLASPLGMVVLWGPDLVQIYNDGYRQVMGVKHPAGLGQPTRECWPEVWPFNAPIYEQVLKGEARSFQDQKLTIERHGRPEDAWFDLTYSPLRDDAGGIAGVLVTVIETTAKVQSEAALRRREAQASTTLDRFFDLSADLFATASLNEGHWKRVNGAFARILGWTEDELMDTPFRALIHPDDMAASEAALAHLARGERLLHFEQRIRGKHGGYRWIAWTTAPDPGGDMLFYVGRDMTERRTAEERQTFLLGLSDALRALSDPAAIQREACRLLAERLCAARAYCVEVHDAEGLAVVEQEYARDGLPSIVREYDLTAFKRIVPRAEPENPVVVADAATLGVDRGDAISGHRAGIAIPLVGHEQLIGALCVAEAEPRDWTDAEVQLARDAAERIWAAVDRARTESQVLALAERNHEILESISDAFYAVDRNWRFTYVNRKAEEWWSRGREELLGRVYWTEFPEAIGSEPHAAHLLAAAERRVVRLEAVSPILSRWVDISIYPAGDGGLSVFFRDITGRRMADERLRESEERFRSFAENSADTLWIADALTGRLEYLSPAFETTWGESRERIMNQIGRWAELVHPDDRERAITGMPRLLAGEAYDQTYRIVRPSDGAIRFIHDAGFPIRDGEGRVYRVGGIAQDVTEAKLAERGLADSEARLRTLMEGIPQLVWRSHDQGQWTWSSPQWQQYTGQTLDQSVGRGWLDAVHPDDRAATMAAWDAAQAQELLDVEYRVCRASDRAYLWHHTRSLPVHDHAGRIVEWLGTTTDVQELKQLQERQSIMVAELQHRTRNLIAVVRSIAQQTMNASRDMEAFTATFNDRLAALSRVQGLLSRSEQEPITLGALIRTELDALGGGTMRDRIMLDGPETAVRNSTVQTLSLAIHELATNARKYGALAGEQGRLAVSWRVEDPDGKGRRLRLEWIEQGSDAEREANGEARRGYGRELIERALPYALGAKTSFELNDAGLRCTIDLPIESRRQRRSR